MHLHGLGRYMYESWWGGFDKKDENWELVLYTKLLD